MRIGKIQYSTIFHSISKIRETTCYSLVFLFMLLISVQEATGQNPHEGDTLKARKEKKKMDTAVINRHSPTKATIYSMILPGLGQAYNRKYWKIPIVYAGFGVFYYLIDYNNTEYQLWRDAYNHAMLDPDGLEDPVNDYEKYYGDNPDFLRARKNDARRYRDLNYILAGLWYVLNIVDATVDAHLFTWEVDDNLSLRMEPHLQNQVGTFKPMGGVKFSLRF